MLKVSHHEDLVGDDNARVGINFDGTIIIQGMGEFHIHPDDLTEGTVDAVGTRNSMDLDAAQVQQIRAVLAKWEADGNSVMGKHVIRPMSAKIPAQGIETEAGLTHGEGPDGISLP
tara:strand:+ start:4639 stop:4986 length:348 start_codon:yes stop_codon:yes gene_type:complete